ncbi:MAG: N-acetylmuramoyl-L-alanine amidase [Haliscomenobacter sp.]|nr:N-acetylmuramoyl-L-alanine amidase [Haliscomenobacter sp.]
MKPIACSIQRLFGLAFFRLPFLFAVAVWAFACTTPSGVREDPLPAEKPRTGFLIPSAAADLGAALEKGKKEGHSAAFLLLAGLTNRETPQPALLESFIKTAHEKGLEAHLLFHPGSPEDNAKTLSILSVVAELNDIDGLSFWEVPAEVQEAISAKALLVKPYLWISAGREKNANEGLPAWPVVDFSIELPNPAAFPPSFLLGKKQIQANQALGLQVNNPGLYTLQTPGHTSVQTADAEGWLYFLLPSLPETLRLETPGKTVIPLPTSGWKLPFKYAVTLKGAVERAEPWVELRRFPSVETSNASFDFLAKAAYPADVFIGANAVKQYQTGIFFETTGFAQGQNRIKVRANYPNGASATYFWQTNYQPAAPRPAAELWIDSASVNPNMQVHGLASDRIRVSFSGSKSKTAWMEVSPGKLRLPMERNDLSSSSAYQTDLPFSLLKAGQTHSAHLVLQDSLTGKKRTYAFPHAFQSNPATAYPMLRIIQDNALIAYNMGPIRLGGPLLGEYPKGIILQSSGKTGNYYRIRLDEQTEGFIDDKAVEVLPTGTSRPQYYLQSVSVSPSAAGDVLRIPYPEPVPYAVQVVPEERQLRIRLYGVKTSSTWMSHRAGLRLIDRVGWEQPSPETYELIVHLTDSPIWGYTLKTEGNNLVLLVKYPPALQTANGKPTLAGIKVSIEAGHGGSNTGAEGLSGLLEKDVNLDVALRLEKICREAGMEVLQVRPTDTYMTLEQKRAMVERSDADLHVSIHANSGGGGYLRVSGASTYYHNPLWEDFARTMYGELLKLGLAEFGVVGSFNYHVTRISSRPAILVEMAFLSHAEDEERLASPAFRQRMAEQIFAGIKAYLE